MLVRAAGMPHPDEPRLVIEAQGMIVADHDMEVDRHPSLARGGLEPAEQPPADPETLHALHQRQLDQPPTWRTAIDVKPADRLPRPLHHEAFCLWMMASDVTLLERELLVEEERRQMIRPIQRAQFLPPPLSIKASQEAPIARTGLPQSDALADQRFETDTV